jgi:alkylation response protein AidB-like acyl-CoA dehydrogenase
MEEPAAADAVSDKDFEDIRDATRHFVRSVVMPRELEIMAEDRVPDDIRDQAKKMVLFGYRDVRLLRLYEGTSEIQRLIIGGGLVKAATTRP